MLARIITPGRNVKIAPPSHRCCQYKQDLSYGDKVCLVHVTLDELLVHPIAGLIVDAIVDVQVRCAHQGHRSMQINLPFTTRHQSRSNL